MLTVLICLATLIQGAVSECPQITAGPPGPFPTGSRITVPCPQGILTYTATCTMSGLWDHGARTVSCSGGVPSPPPPNTTPYVPPPPPRTNPPSASNGCPYLPNLMRPQDQGLVFTQGRIYDMTCPNGAGTFVATCQGSVWTYGIDVCGGVFGGTQPGVVQPTASRPSAQTFSTYRPVGTVSITPSPPQTVVITDDDCPFVVNYMRPQDSAQSFADGTRYRMYCQAPNQDRLFVAVCRDGQWFGDENGSCASGADGVFGGLGNLFGNLFGRRAPPATTAPSTALRRCLYEASHMNENDVGATFPHGTRYWFRCTEPDPVNTLHLAYCNDGTWEHNERDCYRRQQSILDSGLRVGNSYIPTWFLLAARG